jgi:predicted CoA-binding protein
VVIGASRDPESIGACVQWHVIEAGFTGQVYAVNPATSELQGVRCYADVSQVPGPVVSAGTASRQGAWSAARAHRAKHSTPLDNADLSYVWRKRITRKAVEEAIREAGSQDQAR